MRGRGGYGLASSSLSPSLLTCSFFFFVVFSLGIWITRKKTRSTTTQMASMRMDGTQLRQRLKSSLIEYLHRGRSSYLAGKTLQGRGTRDSANWSGCGVLHLGRLDSWPFPTGCIISPARFNKGHMASHTTNSLRELVYFWL